MSCSVAEFRKVTVNSERGTDVINHLAQMFAVYVFRNFYSLYAIGIDSKDTPFRLIYPCDYV